MIISAAVCISKSPVTPWLTNITVSTAIAADIGALYSNSVGFYAGLRKRGSLEIHRAAKSKQRAIRIY